MNQTYSLDTITRMVGGEFSEYVTASSVGTDAASYDVVRFTVEADADRLDTVIAELEQFVTTAPWYDESRFSVDTTNFVQSGDLAGCVLSVYRHLMN